MTDTQTTTTKYTLTPRQNKLVVLHNSRISMLLNEVTAIQKDAAQAKELFESKESTRRAAELALNLEKDARDEFLKYLALEDLGVADDQPFKWQEEPKDSGTYVLILEKPVVPDPPPADLPVQDVPAEEIVTKKSCSLPESQE